MTARDMKPAGHIDALMAAAWPPAVVEEHGGWLFRYTHGVTRRANSVLAVGAPADLDAMIAGAEAFYEAHNAKPVFLISDASVPVATQESLLGSGYVPQAVTWMLSGSARTVTTALPGNARWRIAVSSEPDDDWFGTYWYVESPRHRPEAEHVMRTQLLRPDSPARFVTVYDADAPVSGGASDSRRRLGLRAVLGHRQGAGTQIVRALANEALWAQVPNIFAAVTADNHASLSLFGRAGLARSHRYRYFAPVD